MVLHGNLANLPDVGLFFDPVGRRKCAEGAAAVFVGRDANVAVVVPALGGVGEGAWVSTVSMCCDERNSGCAREWLTFSAIDVGLSGYGGVFEECEIELDWRHDDGEDKL